MGDFRSAPAAPKFMDLSQGPHLANPQIRNNFNRLTCGGAGYCRRVAAPGLRLD
jgi:hypothetical protein